MKKVFKYIIILIFVVLISACNYGTDNLFYKGNYVNNRAEDLKELAEDDLKNLPSEYSFVIITDVHVGSVKENPPPLPNEEFIKWLESFEPSARPKFCLCLGDVADTGSDNQFIEFKDFVKRVEALGVKVFNSVGNHDLYNSGWDGWKANCYPYTSFYTFKTANYSFYSLDTGTGTFGTNQLKRFRQAIENDSRPKIIFTHYPLYTETFFFNFDDTTERSLMMHYLGKNNAKLYFAGHLHWFEEHDFGAYKSYALPSFRYKGQWTLVKINENTQDYSIEVVKK